MSNISTAFAAIKALLGTLYATSSGYIQLTNPYDIAENTTASLEKGWGVAFGAGTNTHRELGCRLSVERKMTVTLTRRRFANELDTAQKEDAEKNIFEDQFLLIKNLENEPTINNAISGITKFAFESDGGIESVYDDTDTYIKLVSVFQLEYFENLQP